jgi:radical SAM protein with 4Fe4S-binding SPASM domain
MRKQIRKLEGIVRRTLKIYKTHPTIPIIQTELAGKCTANCEFCDWIRRPKKEMVFMNTDWAKKIVRECQQIKPMITSFHVTGESLDHPDLFEILPHDINIGISTNCLSLEGEIAEKLSQMRNLNLILAILWAENDQKMEKSLKNAIAFLENHPRCRTLSVQMICSEHSIPHAPFMYQRFSPYLKEIKQLKLFWKQPYTQEPEYPTLGYIPEGVIESDRVSVDRMPTPQSCGTDCLAITPNPMSSLLIQSDGWIKPCFKRVEGDWGIGHIKDMTLMEAWNSERLVEIRKIWYTGDPDNKQACHDCIRMALPRGHEDIWWNTTNVPPHFLDKDQALKGGEIFEPYKKPTCD